MTDGTAPEATEAEGDPEPESDPALEVALRLGKAAREGDTERQARIADTMRITGKHR